jgi:galactokinase
VCCALTAAIADEIGVAVDPTMVASLARRAENDYVGSPTGVMDQLASMLGIAGHATFLDCRTLSSRQVPLDLAGTKLSILLIDTGARHELVSSEYGDRRRASEQATEALGVAALRDASPEQVETLDDAILARRARHVVTEIALVRDVVDLLDDGRAADIGPALTASHLSLRDDYEVSCAELDVAVDAALAAGALGARMTGGGFGGCVIALCRLGQASGIEAAIGLAYRERGWQKPRTWDIVPSAGAHRAG